ncbi:hypothetical protein [Neisseria cinerea]|uniref:hypothetical protein n=1 Tax=Neisseria cinerea TaxID=483 RepID=UPI0028892ADE|nr:hypothetical protein [Neisseria cinerea]
MAGVAGCYNRFLILIKTEQTDIFHNPHQRRAFDDSPETLKIPKIQPRKYIGETCTDKDTNRFQQRYNPIFDGNNKKPESPIKPPKDIDGKTAQISRLRTGRTP